MRTLFCAVCGKSFNAKKNQWFCTDACRREAETTFRRRGLPLRKCVICDKTFQPERYSPAETCSLRCHDRLPFSYPSTDVVRVRRVIVEQKKCKHCGEIFEATATAQIFCSQHCKDEYIKKTLKLARYQLNTCVACGEEFYALDANDLYCSQHCENAFRQINSKGNNPHECHFCGKMFTDGTNDKNKYYRHFFCSKECYRKNCNAQKALKIKKATLKKHKVKPDGLAETNARARALGLSYGQYQYLKRLGRL